MRQVTRRRIVQQARDHRATFCTWKAKSGGRSVSQARKLRALEYENVKLKRLLAEAILDNAVFKEVTQER